MDIVAWSDEIALFNAMWRIRTQPAGLSVETVLEDHIGAGIIFRRFQHIVLDASDMRDKGESIGRIGCDRMRSDRSFLLVNGSRPNGAVCRDRIYGDIAALVISAKHVAAAAVGCQEGRRIYLRCGP